MIFSHLRTTEWNPQFKWVTTWGEAADLINRPHEDYPDRVDATINSIIEYFDYLKGDQNKTVLVLDHDIFNIHNGIFRSQHFSGKLRTVNVTVGLHRPPMWQRVQLYWDELFPSTIESIPTLLEWYKDFETLHPFQDGNGRVGGVVVAAISHYLHKEKGFLAALQ